MKYALIALLLCGSLLAEPGYTRIRGMWVSDQVCRSDPAFCGMPINGSAAPAAVVQNITMVNQTIAKNETFQSLTNRSAAACLSARAKDWRVYGSIMASNNIFIDIWNVKPENMNPILDIMAKSKQSNQARCMRGEKW